MHARARNVRVHVHAELGMAESRVQALERIYEFCNG